ncbi:hypothetical protein HY639_02640 [Candidatus Woesearchaeota archaeon]|nr:hypothetical protein [Candidatus Woesearchaeota archaeon]
MKKLANKERLQFTFHHTASEKKGSLFARLCKTIFVSRFFTLGIVLAAMVFSLFFANGTLTGYANYQSDELETARTNLTTCYSFVEQVLRIADTCQTEKGFLQARTDQMTKEQALSETLCRDEVAHLNELVNATSAKAQEDALQCEANADAALLQHTNQTKTYEVVIAHAARTICCKEKVDDLTINGYDVRDRIVCTADGPYALSCG